MLKVNKTKCIKCYKCISICPFTVLEKKDDDIPGLTEGKNCMRCMHCAAICPSLAFEYNGAPAIYESKDNKGIENFGDLEQGFALDLSEHVIKRRSIRHFTDEPVDKELISRVLDLTRWAPSAKNQHPTKYIVVNSKEKIQEMMKCIIRHVKETGISPEVVTEFESGNNVVFGEASTLLLAYARNDAVNPPGDTYIAMATAELLLQAQGVGTCWCGYLTRFLNSIPDLRKLLPEIPENSAFYASFMLGYPKNEKYINIPKRINEAEIKWVD